MKIEFICQRLARLWQSTVNVAYQTSVVEIQVIDPP